MLSTCSARLHTRCRTSAASVVLLPLPVGPVTSSRPRERSTSRRNSSGSPSASRSGTVSRSRRSTMPRLPPVRRCRLPRRRWPPSSAEKSRAPPSRRRSARRRASACAPAAPSSATRPRSRLNSDASSTIASSTTDNVPQRRLRIGWPTARWRSVRSSSADSSRVIVTSSVCSIASSSQGAATANIDSTPPHGVAVRSAIEKGITADASTPLLASIGMPHALVTSSASRPTARASPDTSTTA